MSSMQRVLRRVGLLTGACALLCSAPVFAQASDDEAGDVSEVDKDRMGPLRERVRPVSGHIFLKRLRLEISPSITVTSPDAFWTKYVPGGSITFHVAESIAFGVRGGFSLPVISGAASICQQASAGGLTCGIPTFPELEGTAPGAMTLLGGFDVQWAPIYGKISLLAERFAHFDMYAIGGVSLVQYLGPSPTYPNPLSVPTMTVGGNVGVGMRFFLNRFLAVRAELRDLIYVEKRRSESKPTTLRSQLLYELGLSFFLPTTFNPG